ncbi:porin [Marinomonas sp.]|uniref:porin n=1 Tax=Marinomonas sp. TaxID=1904862 RepID=UPI003F98C715
MKKSIVALAVSSAALASISAYAAEDTSVDFYGNIQYAYATSSSSASGVASEHEFVDNGSTIGFKGESKVTDDVTAFFKYELEFDADEENSDVDAGLDQAYVGLKGNFGKVQAGSFDSIYNNAIQDGIDQFENLGFTSGTTSAEGKTVAYFSPSLSGFQVQLSAGLGTETNSPSVDTNTTYTGVVSYSSDMVSVALAYDSLENKSDVGHSIGLAATVTPMDNLAITAKYERTTDTTSSSTAANEGGKAFGLAARYGYGLGDVYGSYQKVNLDDNASTDDYSEYAAGITYSINSSMYVYTEIGRTGSDKSDVSALGVTYVF